MQENGALRWYVDALYYDKPCAPATADDAVCVHYFRSADTLAELEALHAIVRTDMSCLTFESAWAVIDNALLASSIVRGVRLSNCDMLKLARGAVHPDVIKRRPHVPDFLRALYSAVAQCVGAAADYIETHRASFS